MRTINLNLLNPKGEISGVEIPKVPELVQQYLELNENKKLETEGKFFKIEINGKNNPVDGHGIGYSCQMSLLGKSNDSWSQVWTTGMRQYRSPYASEIDNWDYSISEASILSETAEKVIFGFSTGVGNVKIHSFSQKNGIKFLDEFSLSKLNNINEMIEKSEKAIDDPLSFLKYIGKIDTLRGRWHNPYRLDNEGLITFDVKGKKLSSWEKGYDEKNIHIMVALVDHYDRDYDAIADKYRILIWVKGQGYVLTESFDTGLRHPGGRDYCIGLGIGFDISFFGKGKMIVHTKVGNRRQDWSERSYFFVSWKEEVSDFTKIVQNAMIESVKRHLGNHPIYKPNKVMESIICENEKQAYWILFEQIDTDRGEYNDGWLGDQFRYSLMRMGEKNIPEEIFEDHAYIRPNSKSEATGTQGRNCVLKELLVKDGVISVQHTVGNVENESWEELTF